jgi:hypothetical protein
MSGVRGVRGGGGVGGWGDGTFVRTSAARARIRIFLGPRLNVIFHSVEGFLPGTLPGNAFRNHEEERPRFAGTRLIPLFPEAR